MDVRLKSHFLSHPKDTIAFLADDILRIKKTIKSFPGNIRLHEKLNAFEALVEYVEHQGTIDQIMDAYKEEESTKLPTKSLKKVSDRKYKYKLNR